MPSGTTIEQLQIDIQSSSQSAVSGIESLSNALGKLRNATKGGLGLSSVANNLSKIESAASGISTAGAYNINMLAASLEKLRGLGSLKISSSIASQLRKLSEAANSLSAADLSGVGKLSTALAPLGSITKASGLQSTITQLNKLPLLAQTLNSIDWSNFTNNISKLSSSLTPLVTKLNAVGTAFSRLPANIRATAQATQAAATSNNSATTSYINLWARMHMIMSVARRMATLFGSMVKNGNDYVESMNLFSVSMGRYADEAYNYAQQVSDLLGIDPAEWMQKQGVFQTIITGFGVASDKAYIMSKNLTQLGYDLSSLFNKPVAEAMTKLQSGISGELEPLRQLGFDLSVARLQQEALNLGIEKSVNNMTQAEKSQLRYYAIMTQVTTAHHDMARTLDAPANQLRVLRAQLTLCSRAIGNLFIPMLNKILPYAIAAAKAVRYLVEQIGLLFGIQLPKVDYEAAKAGEEAMAGVADKVKDTSGGLKDANEQAKKLKKTILGFDELNILADNSDTSSNKNKNGSGDGAGLGGDLGIDLPQYDFLEGLTETRADGIFKKIKPKLDWIVKNFDKIADVVKTIGMSLLAWKLAKTFLNELKWISDLAKAGLSAPLLISVGVILAAASLKIEWAGIKDALKNGVNKLNLGEMIGGALGNAIAGAIIGKGVAKLITRYFKGSALEKALMKIGGEAGLTMLSFGVAAIIAGIPAFATGVFDAIKNGINWKNALLTIFGSTLSGAGIGAIIGTLFGGPIGAIGGALIGLVVGGLVDLGIAVYQHFDEIKATVAEKMSAIKDAVTSKFGELVDFVKTIPSKIGNFVLQVVDWFEKLPGKIGYALGFVVGKIIKWVYDMDKAIATEIPKLIAKISNWFKELPGKIKDALSEAISHIKDFAIKAPGHIVNFVNTAISHIKDFASRVASEAKKIGSSILETIKELPGKLFDLGKDIWDGFLKGLKHSFTAVIDGAKDFVTKFVDGFKDGLGIHSPSRVFANIGGMVVKGLSNGLSNISDAFGFVNEKMRKAVSAMSKGDFDFSALRAKVSKGLKPVGDSFANLYKDIKKGIKDTAKKMLDGGKDWGSNLLKGILNKIGDMRKWVTEHITDPLKRAIKENPAKAPVSLMKNNWDNVMEWVKRFLGGVVEKKIVLGKKAWTYVSGFVSKYLGGVVKKGINLTRNNWTYVSSFVSNFLGGAVRIGVDLILNSANQLISRVFGFSGGGVIQAGVMMQYANGGVIPAYAGGKSKVSHGSMFVAGESGAELVGHIGGRTEVMNRFQLASVMETAVTNGMAKYASYINSINSKLTTCTNAISSGVMYATQTLETAVNRQQGIDPNALYNTVVAATSAEAQVSAGDGYEQFSESMWNNMYTTTAQQNELLRQQNDLLREIAAKEFSTEITTKSIVDAARRKNRRDGRTTIAVTG